VEEMPRVGVLFVHGIGTQVRGRTLVDWGGALASWITRWRAWPRGDGPPAATLSGAVLSPDPSEPPSVTLTVDGRSALLAESWWAETVLPPTYVELLRWAFVIVPWTIASHFLTRLGSSGRGGVATAWTFVSMLAALLAMPVLLAILTLILMVGLIPIPQIRAVAGALQRGLAATLGDSLVLLNNDVQRSAIVSRVQRDLRWLSTQGCSKLVVVAHSQGAAIAHAALRDGDVGNVTLVTFGAGIAKLLESEWLMRRQRLVQWAPWLFTAGGLLVALGLWRALPALWQPGMRDRVLLAAVIFAAGTGILALLQSRLPKWLLLSLALLNTVPVIVITWMWLDKNSWSFLLLGAQYVIGYGFYLTTSEERPRPERLLNVTKWLDLYASNDPVSNGALFPPPANGDVYAWIGMPADQPVPVSVEVWNQRSRMSDHTSYWMSADDFVPKVACVVASSLGVQLHTSRPDDGPRLRRAAQRRRWRTAWLAVARAGVLVGSMFILTGQGLTSDLATLQPTDDRPVMALQRGATVLAAEAIAALTPEFVQQRLVAPGAAFAAAPRVVNAASLLVFLVALAAASLLIGWTWRAWDRAEVNRLFEREELAVLQPQLVVFLLASAAVLECDVLTAAGWIAPLRAASSGQLAAIGAQMALFAFVAAYPWIMRTLLFWVGDFNVHTLRRGAGAAALSCLVTLPFLMRDVSHPRQAADGVTTALFGQRPYLALVVLAIWVIPRTGVWRRIERHITHFCHVEPLARDLPAATEAGEVGV
jgi:hypothetical protein